MPDAPRAPGSVPPWAGSRMTMLAAGRGVCCADCGGCADCVCGGAAAGEGVCAAGVAVAGFGATAVAGDGCCALAKFVNPKCCGASAVAAARTAEMRANDRHFDFGDWFAT